MMDEPPAQDTPIAGWEQYLYPPLTQDLQLGDILRKADADANHPESFRVILTPSCDMVTSGGRTPKVKDVLTARCHPIQDSLESINMHPKDTSRYRKSLQSTVLSQGYFQSIIPFPSLAGVIPRMAANLRDLQLVPMQQIGNGTEFSRIAAIDSPFRELVAWAYLQIACRPGLPERDLSSWAKEIIQAVQV